MSCCSLISVNAITIPLRVEGVSPGLYFFAFTIPVSITYLMPGMVMDVSAMLVERTTFLVPFKKMKCEKRSITSSKASDVQHRSKCIYRRHNFSFLGIQLCVCQVISSWILPVRPRQLYLRGSLEDPQLLGMGQGSVQGDDCHGAAGFWQMFGNVPAGACQCFDLLLASQEDQDVLRWGCFL